MGSVTETPRFDIPTHCKAGVVVNEGPNFHVEVQDVPVPEPGMLHGFKAVEVHELHSGADLIQALMKFYSA